MARIRTIKPDFFMSDDIGELTVNARLLYVALWLHADREGRCQFRRVSLMAQCMPFEMDDFDSCIEQLKETGLIRMYAVSGKQYFDIPTFLDHQRPHKTEKASIIPVFNGSLTVKEPLEARESRTGKGKGKGKGREEEREEERSITVTPKAVTDVDAVFLFWQEMMKHPRAKLDSKREKRIKGAIKMGYSVDDLKSAILGCSYSSWHMGKNESNQKYDQLDLILRDAEKIDKFMAYFSSPPESEEEKRKRELDEWAGSSNVIEGEVVKEKTGFLGGPF